ncbi:MAG: LamG domain-containing protein [Candidatus Microsaccharimonas sp.]
MIRRRDSGFTIVELLIVVVVIAILAAITIVSYNGISNRAQSASLQSGLATMKKKIENQKTLTGSTQYPGDLTFMDVPTSPLYQYSADNKTIPYGFCLQAKQNNVTYFITESTSPAVGPCDENFGLAIWWKFNGNNTDSSTKGWTISSGGAPTLVAGQNGQANSAYSFSGSPQAFSAGGFFTNNNSYGAVSLSGWVYPANNPASAQGYFGVKATSDPQFYIGQKAGSNALECRVWTTGSGTYAEAGTVSVTPNTWNFVTLVYDGSFAKCYVNGVAGTPTAASGGFNFPTSGNNAFLAGRISTGYLTGRLDDVRGYTRILTDTEIQAMYLAGAQ